MVARRSSTYSIGVDYGTNSVRALIVDNSNGCEIASHVYHYPTGKAGILLDPKDPNLARQNPADYITGFVTSVKHAVAAAKKTAGFMPELVVGIGVDTTGSTPLPIDRDGTPLAMLPQFKNELAAYAWLWKDHTSHAEAAAITEQARKRGEPYLAKCGGTYSSEWFWSKIWHCRNVAPKVFDAAYSWVECADFIPAYITGNQKPESIVRSICTAGHKAMYNQQWGGLPSKAFLASLDPQLGELRDRLYENTTTSDQIAGHLTPEIAKKTGLKAGIAVAVGEMDAHMGAIGAGIRPGTLVKIMGTSTCDIMVAPAKPQLPDIPGLCGIVPGSVVPGMYGLEAGQSAVGDIFNWFAGNLAPASFSKGDVHKNLTAEADKLAPGASGLVALDWNNGNRTILVNPRLTGLLVGQTLHTTAPEIYRALIEATAYGALTIIKRFEEHGVKINEVINCGGIAEKNAMVMQIYADVCNRPMKISRSGQTCALGAAIFGAVVGKAHPSLAAAQKKMTGVKSVVYRPRKKQAAVYAELYGIYRTLHDAFGTKEFAGTLNDVMEKLLRIRERARKG